MAWVDTDLKQNRYWNILIGSTPLPDYMMDLVKSIEFSDNTTRPDEALIEFDDPAYRVSQDSDPCTTLADIKSSDSLKWLFQAGREITIQIGHTKDTAISFAAIISAISPIFPKKGNPTLKVYFRDHGYKMQQRSTDRKSFSIKKLSELVKKIATAHGMGYHVEDLSFDKPYVVTPGHLNDLQILTQVCNRYHYICKVVGMNIVVYPKAKPLKDLADSYRYQFFYRIGDCSIDEFRPREKPVSINGLKASLPNEVCGARRLMDIDALQGRVFLAAIDRQMYGKNNVDWSEELDKLKTPGDTDDAIIHMPRGDGANTITLTGQTEKDNTSYNLSNSIGFLSRDGNAPVQFRGGVDSSKFQVDNAQTWYSPSFDTEQPVSWVAKTEETKKGDSTEVSNSGAKDAEDAQKKLGGAVEDNYDAILNPLMFDPLVFPGTVIKVFGVGHRCNGRYRVTGRYIKMSRDEEPTMEWKLKRAALPSPSAKKPTPAKATVRFKCGSTLSKEESAYAAKEHQEVLLRQGQFYMLDENNQWIKTESILDSKEITAEVKTLMERAKKSGENVTDLVKDGIQKQLDINPDDKPSAETGPGE